MRPWIGGLLLVGVVGLAPQAQADQFDDGYAAFERNDYVTAIRLWQPLAEQGNIHAQFNLGLMYEKGQGVPPDDREAARLYRMAALQGNADAQYFLGLMYESGRGTGQDPVRAYMWFHMSATRVLGATQWSFSGLKALASRNRLATELPPAELARAQEMARTCDATLYAECG
jgi:TPR repeat protein